jgi:SnoaL-like polyketide cyclase
MAERDLVWTRFSAAGTHLGSFLGAAPTGRTVTYTGMDLNRIADGRIVESWVNYDALALLQQVGLVTPINGFSWRAPGSQDAADPKRVLREVKSDGLNINAVELKCDAPRSIDVDRVAGRLEALRGAVSART